MFEYPLILHVVLVGKAGKIDQGCIRGMEKESGIIYRTGG
jgi:hypothetical protein